MIVVDSHAVMWMSHRRELLSVRAESALREGRQAGELAIADISLAEIADTIYKSRVAVDVSLLAYLKFVEARFRVISVTSEIANRAVRFGPQYPRDPADRIIGATALIHGATLVTADRKILASGEVDCIW